MTGSLAPAGTVEPRSARTISVHCGHRPRQRTPAYPDTLYVDSLIGPDTVNTLPEDTIDHFEDHGTLARTVDVDVDDADETMRRLDALGIDMEAVGVTLEHQGVAAFHESFQQVLRDLEAKAEVGMTTTKDARLPVVRRSVEQQRSS